MTGWENGIFFLPEHSIMIISYRVVSWGNVGVVHVILVSAQVLLVLTFDFGLGLDIKQPYSAQHCCLHPDLTY